MLESMTGFGEGRAQGEALLVSVSIRSVNHRYLDVSIRMPEFLRRHEQSLVELVRSQLTRGRIELRVDASPLGEESRQVTLRLNALRSYHEAIAAARDEGLLPGEIEGGDLLRLPEVVEIVSAEMATGEEDVAALEEATQLAIDQAREARRTEGERLGRSLRQILDGLRAEVAALHAIRETLRDQLEARVRERLEALAGDLELDSDRVALEVAILAERSDVQEEIDRLDVHIRSFDQLLSSPEPVGKKLDFLCQEILRELNTVGSKVRDSQATGHVLEAKVVCEQLREQVQNIQ
jgi:uncharacterized protein (TIGR00255 family)